MIESIVRKGKSSGPGNCTSIEYASHVAEQHTDQLQVPNVSESLVGWCL